MNVQPFNVAELPSVNLSTPDGPDLCSTLPIPLSAPLATRLEAQSHKSDLLQHPQSESSCTEDRSCLAATRDVSDALSQGNSLSLEWENISSSEYDPSKRFDKRSAKRRMGGRRNGQLTAETAKEAYAMRQLGACLLCSLAKVKVS
jgi:hypothetical protein